MAPCSKKGFFSPSCHSHGFLYNQSHRKTGIVSSCPYFVEKFLCFCLPVVTCHSLETLMRPYLLKAVHACIKSQKFKKENAVVMKNFRIGLPKQTWRWARSEENKYTCTNMHARTRTLRLSETLAAKLQEESPQRGLSVLGSDLVSGQ